MELAIRVQIEELAEALEIARNVAWKLIDAQSERGASSNAQQLPIVAITRLSFLPEWAGSPDPGHATSVAYSQPPRIAPNHSGDMPEGTLRAILKQAGIEPDDFLAP